MYIYGEATPRISFIFQTLVPIWSPWTFLTPSITSKIPCILFNECPHPLSVLMSPGSHLEGQHSSPVRFVQWAQGRSGILLAQLCFQTVAPSPALMLTPADPHHPIALFRVIFVIPHAMKILTPGGNHSQHCPFQNWSVFKTCSFQYPGMVSPRDLSFLSQHCLGPAPGLFSNIAAPQYLSPPSLSSPSLAIACPLCLLSSTPHPQGALIQNSSGPTRTCKLATLPLPWPSSPLSPPSLHSLGSAVFNRTTPPSLFTPILGQPPAAVIVTCTSYLPSSQTAKHSGEKQTTWLMSFTSVTAHLKGIPSVSQMSSLDHAGPFAASSLLFLHP